MDPQFLNAAGAGSSQAAAALSAAGAANLIQAIGQVASEIAPTAVPALKAAIAPLIPKLTSDPKIQALLTSGLDAVASDATKALKT